MRIRPVEQEDAAPWLGMRSSLWPTAEPAAHRSDIADFFRGRSREPLAVLVAENDEGLLVGFVELSVRAQAEGCEGDRIGYLEGWYVEPAVRRCGCGRLLVQAAEQWARENGCTEFASDAELENHAGVRAHLGVGFEEVGRIACFRKNL
jgi:aminoglycoside 6'-N-acetyltransferase I